MVRVKALRLGVPISTCLSRRVYVLNWASLVQLTPLNILLLLLSVFTSVTTHFTQATPDNTGEWGGENNLGWMAAILHCFRQFRKCHLPLNSVPSFYPPARQIAWAQPLQPFWPRLQTFPAEGKTKKTCCRKSSGFSKGGPSPQEYLVSKQNLTPGFSAFCYSPNEGLCLLQQEIT